MAEVKISELTSATTPLAGTETVPIVQGGVTKKVAVSNFGGASVNPTSTYIPYNNSGVFANSVFSQTNYPFGGYKVLDASNLISTAINANGGANVLNLSPSFGYCTIGANSTTQAIGVDANSTSFFVGSSLTDANSYSTIAKWIKVTDESNNTYYLPLYQ